MKSGGFYGNFPRKQRCAAGPSPETILPKDLMREKAPSATPWDVRDEPGLSGRLHDPVYTLKLLDTDRKGLILYE